MYNEPDIWFVNAHAECNGRHNTLRGESMKRQWLIVRATLHMYSNTNHAFKQEYPIHFDNATPPPDNVTT